MYDSEISLLCIICDRNKSSKAMKVLEKQTALVNLIALGKGTANSKILNYLGLGEEEKSVFWVILPTNAAYHVMEELDKTLLISKPGHGISFLTKICRGCYHKPVEYSSEENGELAMEKEMAHNLIMVVLNRGYSDEVMEAARAAGATGGTVLHARGCGMAGMEKFFGVTITPEKEMIMMVAANDICNSIMEGIAKKCGPTAEIGNAEAISFSIPVNHVEGIGEKTKIG